MNHLSKATSPYLLQHKDNPVDWREWGDDAFAEARRRDVPLFLSVGYSSCHWCHVMAHESFEDPRLAAFLNANFVSIKVDREERPDIDAIYMKATVALTGSGGWPMSVFLDHEARPFYAGTYFPPEPRHGMPSFLQLLTMIDDAWRGRRDEVQDASTRIREALVERADMPRGSLSIDDELLQEAVHELERGFDLHHAGFGGAPKFPPSMVLEFLLREAARTQDTAAATMAERTLTAMARGGLYDQLGGGFARYSVDAAWVVPHFEKMLYDNALLLRVYVHWWRLTGDPLAARVVRETVGFLLTELRTSQGGFAASLDADSAGVEGQFYVWSPEQMTEVLAADDAAWAGQLLSVTTQGSFEHGTSTLQMQRDPEDWSRWLVLRQQLLQARSQRIRPATDDKVVAAWNGFAISALAEAGALFGEAGWVEAAETAARLLLAVHVESDGRLRRTSRDGLAGASSGVIDDYAAVAEGFLVLAQVTGEGSWIDRAGSLLDVAVRHFGDDNGSFFSAADDGEALILRPRELADAAEPSGTAAMAQSLLTYAALTASDPHRERARSALDSMTELAQRAPRAAGWALAACSALLDGPAEITVNAPAGGALHAVALRANAPGSVVILGPTDGPATAMVCRHRTCSLLTSDPRELTAQVHARTPGDDQV